MRRDYDTINPCTHPFIMVPSPEMHTDAQPFWYAAVLGVFHAEIQHTGRKSSDLRPKVMDFLWVRWFEPARNYPFGQKQAKLPKLSFLPEADEFAFGFLDPSLVLRGCHLIPAFADGKMPESLTMLYTKSAEVPGRVLHSWRHYYIGM